MQLRHADEVAEVWGRGDRPALLVEVAHGATDRADYDRVAARLRSPLPADLHHFFHVNTDVGAWEIAWALAEALAPLPLLLVRCRLPRTFVDCNRVLGGSGMTPGLAPFVEDEADIALLRGLYARWRARVDPLWEGHAGLAVAPHSYAPRTVGIDRVDAGIVDALHACWAEPGRWPLRPEIDLISRGPEGELGPPCARAVAEAWAAEGLQVAWNESYDLHPSALVSQRAMARPGTVLCFEARRDLLVRAWRPFEPMEIDPAGVARVARPLAEVLRAELGQGG